MIKFEPYIEQEQLDPIDRFCKWFALIVGVGLLIFWWRTGLAQDKYWMKMYEPILVRDIIEVEWPCGRDFYGCTERSTGLIFIKVGLKPILRTCVLTHEIHHMDGYVHPEPRGREFATDCGDGTMVSVMEAK